MKQDNLSFYENEQNTRSVSIVGVPMELGSDERGLREAPRHLLRKGLERAVRAANAEIAETIFVPCRTPERTVSAGSAKYLDEIIAASRVSAAIVERAARRGDFVLALGGDHSISIGTIAGASAAHSEKKIGVIWIDAHADANTHETTLSGNIHGMPAAVAMGHGHPLLTRIGGEGRKVAPKNFLYIGLKDIDAAEIEFMRREKVDCVTMLDIQTHGLSHAVRAIDALRRKVDILWISMDMDSIDEEYAPAVGMPTSGGFTRREILSLAHYIGRTCSLVGLDLVELNPSKDAKNKTTALALELTARFLGGEYSWYTDYIEGYKNVNVAESEREAKKEKVTRSTRQSSS